MKKYRFIAMLLVLALLLSSCHPHRNSRPVIPLNGLSVAELSDDTILLDGKSYKYYMTVWKRYLRVGEVSAYGIKKVEGVDTYRYFSRLTGEDAIVMLDPLSEGDQSVAVYFAEKMVRIPDWAEELKNYPDLSDHKTGVVGLSAKYVRVNGGSQTEYPATMLIESKTELEEFLSRQDQVSLTTLDTMREAVSSYDAAWFGSHYLLMVFLEEPSGSIRHEVRDLFRDVPPKCVVTIDRIVPETGTADMAYWYIFIELNRYSISYGTDCPANLTSDYDVQILTYTVWK